MNKHLSLSSMVTLLFLFASPLVSAQFATIRADAPQLFETAQSVPMGSSMKIEEVQLDAQSPAQTLLLERFAVFTRDAKLVVNGENGKSLMPVPRNAYFRGRVQGNPHARVYLSVLEKGQIRGIVSDRGRFWVAAGGEDSSGPLNGMVVVEADSADLQNFARPMQCESDFLAGERGEIPNTGTGLVVPPAPPHASYAAATYNARIAIESDFEYYQKFGDETDAMNYTADVIAFSSTVYADDLDTSLSISHINIWTTAADPWAQGSTLCGLFEFGRHWNDNNTGIDRTLAHFMSGKNNGGGVAWVGVLCNSAFNYNHQAACPSLSPQTDNYGGDYGYSGDLDGNFNINNPSVVWDIVVVAHEIGHNFNSPHSHCYAGLGGNSSPVDQCHSGQCGQNGCYCGSTSLPCGTPGSGCGTIMSYCHLLGGGISNISMNFGVGHPHGVAPERVASRMNAAVVSAHGGQPDCLPRNPTVIDMLDMWPSQASILDFIPLVSP